MASNASRLEPGPIPLYYQLEQDLRDRIDNGEFVPGSVLPTEDQVCEQYGVSRITVRRAIEGLTQQGLVIRRRGVGSFVAEPAHGMNSRLTGSLNEFLSSATLLDTRWLSLGPSPCPSDVRKTFNLKTGEQAVLLTTIGFLADEPVAYLEIWFPPDVGSKLSYEDVDRDMPVIRIVERKLGFRVVRAEQVVEADVAGAAAGLHLNLDKRMPILKVKRIYYSSGERPIEIAYVRYHPERYRYAIDFR